MTNTNHFYEEVLIAGFGGQGVLLAGKLLAQTAMREKYEVTYMPSYGAEVRGGTAHCMVILAHEPIASPLVTRPDTLIVMNQASVEKFLPRVKSGGLVVYNSSITAMSSEEAGVRCMGVPADEIARKLEQPRCVNMVMLGGYLAARGHIKVDLAEKSLAEVLSKRYHQMLAVNQQAIRQGADYVLQSVG